MKAVIPAAGLGTRFLPATKSTPKEMMPIVDTPAIQLVVEEAVRSGIRDILIVTSRGKRAIEDHFDRSHDVENALRARGRDAEADRLVAITDLADIHYIRQSEPLGLGHAVMCARPHVGDAPFAVLLGDDILQGTRPATAQLMEHHERTGRSVVAVEPVPLDRIHRYGVVAPGPELEPGLWQVEDLVEKPKADEAPSDLGIMGRYVLTPEVFAHIGARGAGGEVQLTDALQRLRAHQSLYACRIDGVRHDTGQPLGWLKTNLAYALEHPEFGMELRTWLQTRLATGADAAGTQTPPDPASRAVA